MSDAVRAPWLSRRIVGSVHRLIAIADDATDDDGIRLRERIGVIGGHVNAFEERRSVEARGFGPWTTYLLLDRA